MAQLSIPNLSDETYRRLQDAARLHGRSVPDEAAAVLDGAIPSVGADDEPELSEEELMRELSEIRAKMAAKGICFTTEEINAAKREGRE